MKFKLDLECQDNKISTFEVETNVGYASEENYDTRIFYKGSEIKADNRRDNDMYLRTLSKASEVIDTEIYGIELNKKDFDAVLEELKYSEDTKESYEYYKYNTFDLEESLLCMFAPMNYVEDTVDDFIINVECWTYIYQFIACEEDYIADCEMDGKIPYKE